jgi:lipopolysaccharide/colanic/teichoic acid biosynthesis glycosyltransferase
MRTPMQPDTTESNREEALKEMEALYSPSLAQTLRLVKSRRKRQMWWFTITFAKVLKRTIDIVVSAGMLILLLPLFAVIAAAIWLTDRGPVLFWQMRPGKYGKEFAFPKFRSMILNAEAVKDKLLTQNQHADQKSFKMKNDPRITPVGRIIRKFSFDELPQLWCVLKGDMSLVGPRPMLTREVKLYTPADRRRLDVLPGLTCIWQVSGRSDIPFERQLLLDVEYIESQSIMFDIILLLRTIPAVLLGKGAY